MSCYPSRHDQERRSWSKVGKPGNDGAMRDPLDADAALVPSIGRQQLVLVDGRTFAISDDAGQMRAATHGLVHDDLRHLCRFQLSVLEGTLEVLAANTPTPLSAVVVARLVHTTD